LLVRRITAAMAPLMRYLRSDAAERNYKRLRDRSRSQWPPPTRRT
jgi:hypothetical protein